MRPNFENIVAEYLNSQRTKDGKSYDYFKNKLRNQGVDHIYLDDLMIRLDDEWLFEQLLVAEIKSSQTNLLIGAVTCVSGIVLSLLGSFTDVFGGVSWMLFYGAILTGGFIFFQANSTIRANKTKLANRKESWKYWRTVEKIPNTSSSIQDYDNE